MVSFYVLAEGEGFWNPVPTDWVIADYVGFEVLGEAAVSEWYHNILFLSVADAAGCIAE